MVKKGKSKKAKFDFEFDTLLEANEAGFYATFQTVTQIVRRQEAQGEYIEPTKLEMAIAAHARIHGKYMTIRIRKERRGRAKYYHESIFPELIDFYHEIPYLRRLL
ncbi:hypothetical protein KY330_03165 [Candidatus Woesearchaeota archaeon]|nr:hypothetical protein [Candidatus Woesearchaeota archaeon]